MYGRKFCFTLTRQRSRKASILLLIDLLFLHDFWGNGGGNKIITNWKIRLRQSNKKDFTKNTFKIDMF